MVIDRKPGNSPICEKRIGYSAATNEILVIMRWIHAANVIKDLNKRYCTSTVLRRLGGIDASTELFVCWVAWTDKKSVPPILYYSNNNS